MELKLVKCTTCGYQTESNTNDKYLKCKACDNYFLVQAGETLNSKDNDDIERLKKLRINLRKSININDHNMIFDYSQDILKILPEDYLGQYFYAYAAYHLNQPKLLKKFFIKEFDDIVPNDLDLVVEHMGNNVDLREFNNILDYIKNHNDTKSHQVKNILNARINKENNYAVVNRDVFICFRSSQIKTANKVVEVLENDGHTCWISTRNLRPDDLENYWHNIYEAMDHCKLFLVISSQESMLSKDIQKEVQYANKIKINKLEYKIDDVPHTTLFKHTFDGMKWINAIQSSNFEDLKSRVFETINNSIINIETVDEKKQIDVLPLKNSTITIPLIVKRIEIDLKIGNFDEAKKKIATIKSIDYENEDAWFYDFVVSFCLKTSIKLSNIENIYEKILNLSDNYLDYFLEKDKSFSNYKALFPSSRRLNKIEKTLKIRRQELLEDMVIESYIITDDEPITLENIVLLNPNLDHFKEFENVYNILLNNKNISDTNTKFLKIQEIFLNAQKKHIDEIENEKKQQKILLEQFHKKIDKLIEERSFSEAEIKLKKSNLKKTKRYYEQLFLVSCKSSSLQAFLKQKFTINEKKKIVKFFYFHELKDHESLLSRVEQFRKDIIVHNDEERKSRIKYRKQLIEKIKRIVRKPFQKIEKSLIKATSFLYIIPFIFIGFIIFGFFRNKVEEEEYVIYDNTIIEYKGTNSDVVIPDQVGGVLILYIGDAAFANRNLTSVTIPYGVVSIGAFAFANNNLTSVTIPSTVTSIGASAFNENNLTSVTISYGVELIGASAFANNNLTSITIPSTVTSIGESAFDNNNLADVIILGAYKRFNLMWTSIGFPLSLRP